jgi:putative endopeptidase
MRRIMIMSIALAAVAAMAGCGGGKKTAKVPAINLADLDTSVKPGDDFYQYACGGWIAANPLRPEYSRFGSFDRLGEENLNQLRTIVDGVAGKKHEYGTIPYKIATMYNLGMDSVKLNAEGAEPIKEQLASIAAIKDAKELTCMIGRLHRLGIHPYFGVWVDADDKNSSMNIALLQQTGLGMGDRDYYLLEDAETVKIRDAYKEYISKLFVMTGHNPESVDTAVDAVMKIENRIAGAQYTRLELRDSYANYNKMPVAQLAGISTLVDWGLYFTELGLPGLEEVNVRQINYYPALEKAMGDVTLEEQKLYLAFNVINEAASFLSDEFADASFDFYGRAMSGREEQQPRWKRVLSATDRALSEAFGQLYVEKYFPASSKERMLTMVNNLTAALGQRIEKLDWMSDHTKAKAQEKLSTFIVKIGYPDTWRDYSGLEIKDDSYWANICRSNIFDTEYQLADAGKPVDKHKWLMSPQTVNAYYNPTTNEICFPAGILQPPFFNADADDAVNYGAIGVVIGHEMTHGFDDQGRNYDKDGNLAEWWTPEDAEKFNALADILVRQYDEIIVLDDVHANGRYTLGENIADQGGLLISYEAYENSLKDMARPADIDGFTDTQRFYLGYAGLWAQNIRPEEILRLTKLDVHSLGKWRVDAALRNIDKFYEAFNVMEGDAMYMAPEERVVIW